MDAERFDQLVRSLRSRATRRATAGSLLGGLLVALVPDGDAQAARDRRKRKQERGHRDRPKGGSGKVQNAGKKGVSIAKAKKKFTLCHNGETITVGKKKAKKAHLRHGDTLGECPSSPPPPPPPATCSWSAQGCGPDQPFCTWCYQTQTAGGETVCADDTCTDVACTSDQDCRDAFPQLDEGWTFCQAADAGCCGQTCLVACGLLPAFDPLLSDCTDFFLDQYDTNSGCTWAYGPRNPEAVCSDDRQCCRVRAMCHDDGYCCKEPFDICFSGDECCNAKCTNNQCCNPPHDTCTVDRDCCNGNCEAGVCCNTFGMFCFDDVDCCTNNCLADRCCQSPGSSCAADSECCGAESCRDGTCCLPAERTCVRSSDCCGRLQCISETCKLPDSGSSTCLGLGASCLGTSESCCANSSCNVAGVCECSSAPSSFCSGSFGECCGGGTCVHGICE